VKPVDQTVLDGDGGMPGNCLAACIASLLECAIEDVPQPTAEEHADPYWTAYNARLDAWLAARGLYRLRIYGDADVEAIPAGAYWIASGLSPRDKHHATVWRGGELAHDPHPSRAGILDIVARYFLVPISPEPRP
jgi:hypothetical protein